MSIRILQRGKAWQVWYYDREGKRKAVTLKIDGRNPANRREAETACDRLFPDLMALDAIRTHAQAVEEIAKSRHLLETVEKHKLNEMWDLYLLSPAFDPDITKQRKKQLEYVVGSFIDYLEKQRVFCADDITPTLIVAWLREVTRERSKRSYNEYLMDIRQVLGATHKKFGMTCNPALEVKTAHRESISRKPYTLDEISRILTNIDDGISLPYRYKVPSHQGMVERIVMRPYNIPYKEEIKASIMLGAYCGMRLVDAVSTKYDDYDNGYIHYMPRKTRHSSGITVTVPVISSELKTILCNGKGYVTPNLMQWHKRNPSTLCSTYKHIFEGCGFVTQEKCEGRRNASIGGFHALRHSFVTACAEAGISLEVVASCVGHTTPMMTRVYAKISQEAKARELAKVFG